MVSAKTLAQDAANAIDPALFQPAIRKAADDFYEQLLVGVQDYLKDNVQFNLSSHILTLEYTVRELRDSNSKATNAIKGLCIALQGILSSGHAISQPLRLDAEAAIAKAVQS